MKAILVTGSNGQLGNELRILAKDFPSYQFIFTDTAELDITNSHEVQLFFKQQPITFCINCAAYTAVDRAEEEHSLAHEINANGPKILAAACKEINATFIHISTDFVFDGKGNEPYNEQQLAEPISIYGKSKRQGEMEALAENPKTIVIRTSWLYSSYGNNFVKTMLRLGKERSSLGVVFDQTGCPTYAKDLAKVILQIIEIDSDNNENITLFGIYHYSNTGVCSWYDFAKAIFEFSDIDIEVTPITTDAYPLPAQRPAYSVMNTQKIRNTFQLEIPYWRDSLKKCIKILTKDA